jgi:hypothetical protein
MACAMHVPFMCHQGASNVETTVVEQEGYTLAELRWRLHQIRGKRVPIRTLYNWLSELNIKPDSNGFYSDEQLALLKQLILFLRRQKSIAAFKSSIGMEGSTNDQQQWKERPKGPNEPIRITF